MSAKRIKIRTKKERPLIVEQWIEVEVFGGKTKSTRYPNDDEVRKNIRKKEEEHGRPVDLVYRRFNFVHGIPPEYFWSTDNALLRQYGGHCIQRLRVSDWEELAAKEKGGHMRGCKYTMPRPDARGGCTCEACQAMARRIAECGR
jgi:hypothetical protein